MRSVRKSKKLIKSKKYKVKKSVKVSRIEERKSIRNE